MTDIELIKYYNKKMQRIVGVGLTMIIVIAMILIFSVMAEEGVLWGLIAVGIVIIVITGINFNKITNEIEKILTNELDPQKYYTVIHGTKLASKYRTEDIQVAYFIGDYASATGMINEQLPKTKADGIIAEYKRILAYCYFETGQFDKLTLLINDLRAYANGFKKDSYYKRFHLAFVNYFENFINGNYESCTDIDSLLSCENEKFISNSLKMRIYCYKALALYHAGRTDEARLLFEKCYIGCPKLNYSVISKKYLELITDGKTSKFEEVAPEIKEYRPVKPFENEKFKLTLKQKISLGVGVLLLIGSIGLFYLDNSAQFSGYDTPLEAIRDSSVADEILATVEVDENNSLYVYSTDSEYIGVAVVEENDKKYMLGISTVYSAEEWKAYDDFGFALANIDKEVYYDITDDTNDISANAVRSEFEFEGSTYYIYIVNIEDNNTLIYSAW